MVESGRDGCGKSQSVGGEVSLGVVGTWPVCTPLAVPGRRVQVNQIDPEACGSLVCRWSWGHPITSEGMSLSLCRALVRAAPKYSKCRHR
jgi:hypothetical protein